MPPSLEQTQRSGGLLGYACRQVPADSSLDGLNTKAQSSRGQRGSLQLQDWGLQLHLQQQVLDPEVVLCWTVNTQHPIQAASDNFGCRACTEVC